MWLAIIKSRAFVVSAVLCAVFAAGFATSWSWQSNKLDAEIERGKSALLAIRAEYAAAALKAEQDGQALRDQDRTQAEEVARDYQAIIEAIKKRRVDTPGPVVRVQCPPAPAVPTTGDRAASDPGSPAGAATDSGGVAGDGAPGYRDLDASGIRAMTTEAMLVSERLRALQERCSG